MNKFCNCIDLRLKTDIIGFDQKEIFINRTQKKIDKKIVYSLISTY